MIPIAKLIRKSKFPFYLINTRMRRKRDWSAVYAGGGGGAVLRIVGGGVTFRFLNGDAFPDRNTPLSIRLYALVVP